MPRSPRTTTGSTSGSTSIRKQTHLGGSTTPRLQVQTVDPTAAAEGDNRATAAAAAGTTSASSSDLPPQSPRSKPFRARGSRGRGGRRRRAAQKQAEAEAAAAALLVSPASSAATAGAGAGAGAGAESPRSMTSMAGEDAYSDADADADAASASYFSSPDPSPLPSPRRQHNYKQEPKQPSSATTPTPTPPRSPFHQQLEGLSHAASQAADAAQAAVVTSSEIFDPPRIQRKMDAMAASAARTASTWSSTIDRPMETIEILTDRLCPVRHDATSDDDARPYNATATAIDAAAFPPPGLQRLRTFSSELSVSSTFDSPRGRAGTDTSFHSTESNHHPAATANATAMPQIAEDLDLKGLALIEEDKDLNLVRTDTHITSMSTASTNFGGANSSQMSTQHYSVTSTGTTTANTNTSVVSSSSPRAYVRPLASMEDHQHVFGFGGGMGGMGSAAPSPRSRTSSCEYSEYSTASTQAILDGHPGVLPPPMSPASHHANKTDRPQYESRFLAGSGGDGGPASPVGGRFWDNSEQGDVYSCSDESSMQSNGYFFRESGATPRSMGLPPPLSASKPHVGAGRGRTFTDPTHAAMGFNQPAPIPFAVKQIEHAKAAALGQHQIQPQGHHLGSSTAAITTTTTMRRKSHTAETNQQARPSVVGNRGRTSSEPTVGGRGGGGTKADELQDDSASLFNISPKSFLLGQQSGGEGDGDFSTQKSRFDYEGK